MEIKDLKREGNVVLLPNAALPTSEIASIAKEIRERKMAKLAEDYTMEAIDPDENVAIAEDLTMDLMELVVEIGYDPTNFMLGDVMLLTESIIGLLNRNCNLDYPTHDLVDALFSLETGDEEPQPYVMPDPEE